MDRAVAFGEESLSAAVSPMGKDPLILAACGSFHRRCDLGTWFLEIVKSS
jgi:hypothetical protein